MSRKLASDLVPGDTVCLMQPLTRAVAGRAKVVEVRESQTDMRSRKGAFGPALMILYYDLDHPDERPLLCDFLHPADHLEVP